MEETVIPLREAELQVIEIADVIHDHLTPANIDILMNDLFEAVRKYRKAYHSAHLRTTTEG